MTVALARDAEEFLRLQMRNGVCGSISKGHVYASFFTYSRRAKIVQCQSRANVDGRATLASHQRIVQHRPTFAKMDFPRAMASHADDATRQF